MRKSIGIILGGLIIFCAEAGYSAASHSRTGYKVSLDAAFKITLESIDKLSELFIETANYVKDAQTAQEVFKHVEEGVNKGIEIFHIMQQVVKPYIHEFNNQPEESEFMQKGQKSAMKMMETMKLLALAIDNWGQKLPLSDTDKNYIKEAKAQLDRFFSEVENIDDDDY